jgi:hypothetical protein
VQAKVMEIAKSRRIIVLVFLAGAVCVLTAARVADSQSPTQADVDKWVNENYEEILRHALPVHPKEVQGDALIGDISWALAVRIRDPFRAQGEFWFSLVDHYSGGIESTVRIPDGKPIRAQLVELKRNNPTASSASLAGKIRVKEFTWTGEKLSELKRFVAEFESLNIPVRMPDTLINDPVVYDFWTMSMWGQNTQMRLIGPGPQVTRQPQPLLQFIEDFRSLMDRQTQVENPVIH